MCGDMLNIKVRDFIASGKRDVVKPKVWLIDKEINEVVKILISSLNGKDRVKWITNKSKDYTVKSRYSWARKLTSRLPPSGLGSSYVTHVDLWLAVSSLKVPPKVCNFVWRLCSNAIPSKVNLFKCKCSLCLSSASTIIPTYNLSLSLTPSLSHSL